MEFIPAKESTWFIALFKWYTWFLFKRRFSRVWIRQRYQPENGQKTVYFLNHSSWWDGLIPLLLNEFRFHQQARALMEDRQMERYRFFRKIGAFSINRDHPRKAITSLRYAVQSMQRPGASLFIYPEGEITPLPDPPQFQGGLAWLHSKVKSSEVDFVPVAICIHTIRSDKPELHIEIGEPAVPPCDASNEEKTRFFERRLGSMLERLRSVAGFEDTGFERFM
ncbi:lysophospholipid acyltransferase family protein [Halalkalibaculum sp. DA3122]|uniref:lysophospholipid acyltransferase family protein n=1 Tax=Halalkalibaculum sp. DA3122 TaxID=3373607 RepID=UPI003754C855